MKIFLLCVAVFCAFGALGSFVKGKFGEGIGFAVVAWVCFAFANSHEPPPPPPPRRFTVIEH